MKQPISEVVIEVSNPYPFNKESLSRIEQNLWVKNQWPIVYFIEARKEKIAYVGESANALTRIKSHLSNPEKTSKLNQISIIASDRFNKSATLDIESSLIQYISAEGKYKLLNGNYGQRTHNYYERKNYRDLFSQIWEKLLQKKIVHNSILDIENSEAFKFSPFRSLNEGQYQSLLTILEGLTTKGSNRIFIEGNAGTGKTVLAIYLIKLLKSDIYFDDDIDTGNNALTEVRYIKEFQERYPNANIAIVVSMQSLKDTLQKELKKIYRLDKVTVMSPPELFHSSEVYDLLIIDEAHRLRQDINQMWTRTFQKYNSELELGKSGNELDWVQLKSKNQIFFYDRDQSIRPSDVSETDFLTILNRPGTLRLKLHSQMRVMGGDDYMSFVNELLSLERISKDVYKPKEYELLFFDSLRDMKKELDKREAKYKLCRMIAGYAWYWASKKDKSKMDIEIEGLEFQWNQVSKSWIHSPNAGNEIGCVHTTMGYDLNYAGVIFGREISYNPETHSIEIDPNSYYDVNGKKGTTPETLKKFIVNIYRNMMYRGIRGTFVYACDPALRKYLKQHIPSYKKSVR
ncbi:MAG: DNA/RNA helicase domain-containing protein [Flavobacteriales bacterium]